MAKKYVADLTVFRAQDARKTGAFLETGSLHPPLAALTFVSPSWVISALRAALRRLRSETRLRAQSRAPFYRRGGAAKRNDGGTRTYGRRRTLTVRRRSTT